MFRREGVPLFCSVFVCPRNYSARDSDTVFIFAGRRGRRPLHSFLNVHADNFGDIGAVIRVGAEELRGDTVIGEEAALREVIAVELAADEHHIRLLEGYTAVEFSGSESRLLDLVAVPARVRAAEGESLAELLAVEGGGEGLAVLDEAEGVPVRAYVAGEHVSVPQHAELTP